MANILNNFLSVFMDVRQLAIAGGIGGVSALITGFLGTPIFTFLYGSMDMKMSMKAPLPLLRQLADPNNLVSTFIVGALIGIVSSAVARTL
jgi:cellobiose-specific phosphotransferase system component IIC